MEEKDIHLQIQAYLSEDMSPNEAQAFEKELDSNQALKADFELFKDINEDLGNVELQQFKKKLAVVVDQDIATSTTTSTPVFKLSRRILSLAASVLVLAIAGWWMSNQNNEINPELAALSESNFLHYPVDDESRGTEDSDKLYDSYTAKDYAIAATTLEQHGLSNQDNKALLFSAIAYLGDNKAEKAIALLTSLADTPYVSNKKYYYLGLAYLKIGEQEKATTAFKQMNEGDPFIYNKVQGILNQLD